MTIEEAKKQVKQLRVMKTHYTDYEDEYREFCVNFLELMSQNDISLLNCQVFKEVAFPIGAQTFDKTLIKAEIYIKMIENKKD
jgi:hypothetical protein